MGDSLSGKNKGRYVAGAGSSPAPPTIKTVLWQKLRASDRKSQVYRDQCRRCWAILTSQKWTTWDSVGTSQDPLLGQEIRDEMRNAEDLLEEVDNYRRIIRLRLFEIGRESYLDRQADKFS